MKKLITKIGKNRLCCLLIAIISVFNLFALDNIPLDNTDFRITTDSQYSFLNDYTNYEYPNPQNKQSIATGIFCYPLKEANRIEDFRNKKLEVTISHKEQDLTYDFSKLMFQKDVLDCRDVKIAFFPSKNYVDVIYLDYLFDTGFRYFVIRYDFINNSVTKIHEDSFGHFLYTVLRNSKTYSFAEEVYKRLFLNESLPEEKFNCYTGDEDLCNGGVDFIYTRLEDNLVYQNPLDKNSNYIDYYSRAEELSIKPSNKNYVFQNGFDNFCKNVKYSASDFLIEGSVKYSPDNLGAFSNLPFAVHNNNKPIEITIECNEKIGGLYICNGFYHETKTYLFKNNNRAKEIEIIYSNSYGLSHKVVLLDNPKPLFIPLLNTNDRTIKIRILSVYKGNKFDDTCINCIKPVAIYSDMDYYNSQK